jgi:glycosyltransferase involved in cell wall biosynthesis
LRRGFVARLARENRHAPHRAPAHTAKRLRRRRSQLTTSRSKLSALVVAHNEEEILADCLSRLRFADEIVVVLDRCTDRSSEIAHELADVIIEGGWEIEGTRRNLGIRACSGDWILEADADEFVPEDLAREIRATIADDRYDNYNIPVRNFVGKHYVKLGWGGGSFGKQAYMGLFRKGTKWWGDSRVHPHLAVSGIGGPNLKNAIDHHVDRDVSDMLKRLNSYTDWRSRDIIDLGEVHKNSLANMFRKFLSRFMKIYFRRKAYKEKELGIMVALCGALYPLIAHIKAKEELDRRGRQT